MRLDIFTYKHQVHQEDFIRLALYFNRLWQWSMPRPDYRQKIPLTRLYRTLRSGKNRPLVKFVANIWFEQRTRGTNLKGECSTWTPRPKPRINKVTLEALKSMAEQNKAVIDEMWRIAAEKNTVEVSLVTSITLPSSELAETFKVQVQEMFCPQAPVQGQVDVAALRARVKAVGDAE